MGAPENDQHARRDVLRFLTCGSVDDGKSTLIGRLLHDSGNVYSDHLDAVRRASGGSDAPRHDLALLLDGLRAEREQGITIDVAYRYFSTPKRKFIIADCPGHEQYTRNMVTGGSTARLAVLLVDATKGLTEQTRRHAFIVSLLEIAHVVVAVNKMDAVDYDRATFERIRSDYAGFAARLSTRDVHFVPVSALRGDNVVHRSDAMRWYEGPPLLEHLENVYVAAERNLVDLRFPVQTVLRAKDGARVYAGSIASGILRPGAEVLVLPSKKRTRIHEVLGYQRSLDEAYPPMAVGITTTDEIDISRGDVLVHPRNLPQVHDQPEALLVWMAEAPLDLKTRYLIKLGCTQTRARVLDLRYRFDVSTIHRVPAETLELNQIGRVRLKLQQPLAFDPYARNAAMGSAILIDPVNNGTVGALTILERKASNEAVVATAPTGEGSVVSLPERAARHGHGALTVLLCPRADAPSSVAFARALERRLFDAGYQSLALGEDEPGAALAPLSRAGMVSIVPLRDTDTADYATAGSARVITFDLDSATTIDELTRRILEAVALCSDQGS